ARRARWMRFSSPGSSWPPASMDSFRRWIARSESSSEIASSRFRMSSNSPATDGYLHELQRMAGVDAGCGEVQRAAGVRARDGRRAGARDCVDLPLADRAGEVGLQQRVCAARAAAQALVVELDDVDVAGEHGAHRRVRALDMAQVARVLH